MSPPHDELVARFTATANAALAADSLSRCAGLFREHQEVHNLVAPLARRAINIGRDLLRPPAVVTAPQQPNRPAEFGGSADDPQQPLRPDGQPLASSSGEPPPSGKFTLRQARQVWEREWIAARVRDHRGNVTAAADEIGMERGALSRKLKELGVSITREPGWKSRKPQQKPAGS